MKAAEATQAADLLRKIEVSIKTLLPHLTQTAYVDRWDKGSPAIRSLNILQEAVGEEPTAGEKPQDTVDHDVALIKSIRDQRTVPLAMWEEVS